MMGATALLAGGAYLGARAQYSAGKANQQIAEGNARLSEEQAADAFARGEEDVRRLEVKSRGLIGSQRARLAAQGLDIESGSALDIQADTAYMTEMDKMTIRTNAAREAWGYKAQAANYRFGGKVALQTGKQQAIGTLLTGGGKAYGNYKTLKT